MLKVLTFACAAAVLAVFVSGCCSREDVRASCCTIWSSGCRFGNAVLAKYEDRHVLVTAKHVMADEHVIFKKPQCLALGIEGTNGMAFVDIAIKPSRWLAPEGGDDIAWVELSQTEIKDILIRGGGFVSGWHTHSLATNDMVSVFRLNPSQEAPNDYRKPVLFEATNRVCKVRDIGCQVPCLIAKGVLMPQDVIGIDGCEGDSGSPFFTEGGRLFGRRHELYGIQSQVNSDCGGVSSVVPVSVMLKCLRGETKSQRLVDWCKLRERR